MDNLMSLTRYGIPFLITLLILLWGGGAVAGTTIKVALITPEGSAWTNVLNEMADEVEEKTAGEVRFKVYPGGVSGDELDVIRKMQAGLIHAAGFSGVGLGVILPEIRILEAPLLYHSYGEVDLIKEKLYDDFASKLEKKGFVLLGFAEAGFVLYFFQDGYFKTGLDHQNQNVGLERGSCCGNLFKNPGDQYLSPACYRCQYRAGKPV